MKIYEALAQTLQAKQTMQARYSVEIDYCAGNASRNAHWIKTHQARIEALCKEHMPRGSGFDNGTTLDDASTRNRLVFNTAFHHMDEHGSYTRWSEHQVIVTPNLALRFDVRVTGRDVNSIKEFIADAFAHALNSDIEE